MAEPTTQQSQNRRNSSRQNRQSNNNNNKNSSVPSVLKFDSQNQGQQHPTSSSPSNSNNNKHNSKSAQQDGFVWYFGYGPICHPQVRQRRNISSHQHQSCVLRDYRLTFAFGGAATLVPAVGFTVHGVLMQIATNDGPSEEEADDNHSWTRLQDFDAGYSVQTVRVVPYTYSPQLDFDDDFFEDPANVELEQDCFAFVMMDEYDENLLEHHHDMEKKPQERYLRLIAQGMMQTGVSPDYVNDEILAVPFVPTRAEADWISFPHANQRAKLPRITFSRYQKLCKRKQQEQEVYFVLHDHVLRLILMDHNDPQYDPTHNDGKQSKKLKQQQRRRSSRRRSNSMGGHTAESHSHTASTTTSQQWNNNPSVQWMKQNAHGAGDLTHISHVIVTDPAVPWAPTPADLTDQHYRWAENQMYDFLMQSNVTAEKIYQLVGTGNNDKKRDGDDPKASLLKKSSSTRLSVWARRLGCVVPGVGSSIVQNEEANGEVTGEQPVEEAARVAAAANTKNEDLNKGGSGEGTGRSGSDTSVEQPVPQTQQQQQHDENNNDNNANHDCHQVVGLGDVEREVTRRTAEKASVQHFAPPEVIPSGDSSSLLGLEPQPRETLEEEEQQQQHEDYSCAKDKPELGNKYDNNNDEADGDRFEDDANIGTNIGFVGETLT